MKYYTLLALFLVLGISRSLAQTGDEEPKRIFLNHKTEFEALKAKEQRLNKVDPNSRLDAAGKRKLILGTNAPAAGQTAKATPAKRQAKLTTNKNPSDVSSTDAAKATAAKIASQPKIVAPVLEQERVGGGSIAPPVNKPVVTKPTSISKH